VSADTIFGNGDSSRRSCDGGRIDESIDDTGNRVAARNVLVVSTPWKSQLIGVELLANDSAGAGRWRIRVREIPLDSGRLSVSDLLFVDGAPHCPLI